MEQDVSDLSSLWSLVREQLITLWAYNKHTRGSDEFQKFLSEGLTVSCLNLNMFNQICYFLLGIINKGERDKLIKWPVINIQDQTKFRKAVSGITRDLIVKYPHFNLKKLPESYLMDPNQNKRKLLDYIRQLWNVAVYISLNDPSVLVMANACELNANEIETATSVVKQARMYEEKIIEENEFPVIKFENIRMSMTNKCVTLKQENLNINQELNKLKKTLCDKGLLQKDTNLDLESLKKIHNEYIDKIKKTTEELQVYNDAATGVLSNLKAVGNPFSLTAYDLGLEKGELDLVQRSRIACDNLKKLLDYMKSKDAHIKEKEEFYNNLENVKKALIKEQNVLELFLSKYSPIKKEYQ